MQNHSSGDSGDREEEDCSGDSIALGIVCSGDSIALGTVCSGDSIALGIVCSGDGIALGIVSLFAHLLGSWSQPACTSSEATILCCLSSTETVWFIRDGEMGGNWGVAFTQL